jgi:recombinational DNA repair protein RecR
MAPRVQTFAWTLLRKALPTGKRACRYSKHINKNCSRCGNLEDEYICCFCAHSLRQLGTVTLGLLKLN